MGGGFAEEGVGGVGGDSLGGWRITVFATNTAGCRLADLELRHRLRARAEDRIRGLKDTGMTNLPLQAFTKNQI